MVVTPKHKGRKAAAFGLAALLPFAGLFGAGEAVGAETLPQIFGALEHGRWVLRPVGSPNGAGSRSICVRPNARSLAVVRGGGGDCRVYTTEDKPGKATLSYSCSGGDQGLTRVRSETPKLMILEAQGIDGGSPFHVRYEGRHAGGC